MEALKEMGLAQPQRKWQDSASAIALVSLVVVLLAFYLRRSTGLSEDLRGLGMVAGLYLLFLVGARLVIPGHTVIPYSFPLAAFSLAVAALFGAEVSLVASLPLALMVAYGLPNTLDLTLFFAISSLFGVMALGNARRLTAFFWAGVAVAVAGSVVVLAYRLTNPATDWIGLTTLAGASVFNGLASASLAILLQVLLANAQGVATPMQLMELTRPDHPLLQVILREAPGTYQHSLQVANLAEQAAESIRADTLLTRVGALYHDAGKATNPIFFIENQVPGFLNPHDDLDPATSAATIIRHVNDGVDLARKYRLPRRILDFVLEHHGTMLTNYQYVKAVKAAGGDESQVDKEIFRYPGPAPLSRETAILMLADGCEARVRAELPKEESDLQAIIKNVIEHRIAAGQLAKTDLTLRDLELIQQSFVATLRGVYHPRVQYPKLENTAPSDITTPLSSLPPVSSTAVVQAPSDLPTSSPIP
jgi:putative nucleotidyltransferase with HDIG domain